MDPNAFAGTGIVILGLVVWIVCAVIAYRRAPSFRRRAWVWGLAGIIAGPFALFALFLLPKPHHEGQHERQSRR